ncbi:Asd/ArgC dimerization domain-containing protein [Paracoccus sp. 1_MG-2023]|uniref:Asd/ArgC dimerization domain-containing protein n=1 Tax=unclassified Paracoccus (in: a-proteobacteria) TaxID=2688777 RepID=UPI001C095F33|nr:MULTISPECIES: Asd/ArgC dimerization domain-containing protein [unclassified Paracoccus (in: a-proteobacteria)]MBU2957952.1 hypothetical protein [Paracoccus sp. C2R09]MDO6668854.1 Asd/ArgC dimerization domain-containing protein [Paracoccus sp. 1_MG-2023]
MTRKLAVLGALGLLGQHLIARLLRDPRVQIVGLHDHRHADDLNGTPWFADPSARDFVAAQTILPPEAPATGDLILSFLPDDGAQRIEATHLGRGARVLSHCEYARHQGLLLAPGLPMPDTRQRQLLATPNCTTAICALPLSLLHRAFGIAALHVTTLQAVSGTDLPGMPAFMGHDNVTSSIPGEARALESELSVLFGDAFPVSCMATRVPVWRGHTMTLMMHLNEDAGMDQLAQLLRSAPGIRLSDGRQALPIWQPETAGQDLLCVVEALDRSPDGWVRMTLRGDNLGMATAGLMAELARMLPA